MKRLLSGNEAIARGAWEAGASVASAYPGTPSTEILENFAKYPHIYAEWATNEKVALDVAIGAAYAGKRAFATMKHVGLNVAADPLFYASTTGIEAGLVIVSADDPSMHSSQNEQDNRQYARFTRIPCLDPVDSQNAKDLTIAGFDLSEQFDTPVLLRPTTRVCHTSSLVEVSENRFQTPNQIRYPRNPSKYMTMPAIARIMHRKIEQRLIDLAEFAETFPYNVVEMRGSDLGIIASGVAYQHAREVFPEASILRLGMVYPLPQRMIRAFAAQVDKLIVMEELDPFIEDQVRQMGVELYVPLNLNKEPVSYPHSKSIFPNVFEFNPGVIRKSAYEAGLLAELPAEPAAAQTENFPNRPPVLCPGCPHRGIYYVLRKLGLPVNGDIGCYSLGSTPPLSTTDTCGCMGASIGVAHGAAVAGDPERHIAILGDSTFFHTGIPALINVVYNRSNVITIITDNRVTGMTGHQPNPGTGKTLQMKDTVEIDIENLVRALGVKYVTTVASYDMKTIEKTLKNWLSIDEPTVLIAREECALLPSARAQWLPLEVTDKCNGCTTCFRVGCPAISKSDRLDPKYNRPLAVIDPQACTGCEICAQVCPRNAILFRDQVLARQEKRRISSEAQEESKS